MTRGGRSVGTIVIVGVLVCGGLVIGGCPSPVEPEEDTLPPRSDPMSRPGPEPRSRYSLLQGGDDDDKPRVVRRRVAPVMSAMATEPEDPVAPRPRETPKELTKLAIALGMRPLLADLQDCVKGSKGMMQLRISVLGESGRVTKVKVKLDKLEWAPEGEEPAPRRRRRRRPRDRRKGLEKRRKKAVACVEGVLRERGRFAPFKRRSAQFDYPVWMR